MGFERRVKEYKLKFADEEYNGLEVTMRSLSIKQLLEFTKLAKLAKDDSSNTDGTLFLFDAFADNLIDWNLTEKGKPVPPTRVGVRDQDSDFIFMIINEWMTATSGIDPKSSQKSTTGFDPESIPMEKM